MTSENIVLVNLPWRTSNLEDAGKEKGINSDSRLGMEHVGLLYLQTLLKNAGIDTKVYDFNFEMFHGKARTLEDYTRLITSTNPSIVGFSSYLTSIKNDFLVAKEIKKQNPETKIIFGGSHASHTAKEILENNLFVDAIFKGEAFGTIVSGVEALLVDTYLGCTEGLVFRRNGKIVDTGWGPRMNLYDLPLPLRHRETYQLTKTASIMPAIGCPAACTFCCAEGPRNHSWRTRDSESLFREIEYLSTNFGINTIETHCDDAFGPLAKAKSHYKNLAQKLIDGNHNIQWRSVLRSTDFREGGPLLDKDFWRLMHKSGLERVYVGFEAGTDDRLRKLKKPAKIEDNKRMFHFLRDLGTAVQYGFIMFFSNSDMDEIRQNQDFLYELKNPSYHNYSTKLIIQPGSQDFKEHKEQNKLQRPFYLPQDYSFLNPKIKLIHDAYNKFIRHQEPINKLCLDLDNALLNRQDETIHLEQIVKVREELLKTRIQDLYQTGRKVLDNPEEALNILGKFNERWQIKYREYLTENAI